MPEPGEVRPAAAVILGPSGSRRGSEGGAAARCPRRLGAGRWPADRTGRVRGRATSSNIALPLRRAARVLPCGTPRLAAGGRAGVRSAARSLAARWEGQTPARRRQCWNVRRNGPPTYRKKEKGERPAPGRASAPRGWAGRSSRALPRSSAGKHAGARRGPSSRGCDPRPVGFAAGQRERAERPLAAPRD
jgi:hypothetical protein